jgi:prenyltransferase beta subunit
MRRVFLAGLCLALVTAPARAQTPDEKKATVAWLGKLQTPDGGFQPAPGQAPSGLRATSSSLRALKYFGGEVPDREKAGAFVRSCFLKDSGGFADRPGGKPDVALTAVGLMALVELKLDTGPYESAALEYLGEHVKTFEDVRIAAAGLEAVGKQPPQAEKWREQVLALRNRDGTFGKGDGQARDTGGAVVALLRLGVKVEDREAVVKTLDAGQRKDGGFGKEGAGQSDLETTYRVMRCYHMLKSQPAGADRCREFIARCRNADGGYGVGPGQPSGTSGTYFAGTILHWLDEK